MFFVAEVFQFQLHEHMAFEDAMIENQIDEVVRIADKDAFLPQATRKSVISESSAPRIWKSVISEFVDIFHKADGTDEDIFLYNNGPVNSEVRRPTVQQFVYRMSRGQLLFVRTSASSILSPSSEESG